MMPALKQKKEQQQDERFDVETHFGFGDNWAEYAAHITPEKIAQAEAGLYKLVPASDIAGKTFLDIGCGSGLHALAALRAGARHVTAVDFDPTSVKTTRRVIEQNWTQNNVDMFSYNILDPSGYQSLSASGYDIVYSWGVLHHTGDMMSAIKNAASHVAPGGLFVIALYKHSPLCAAWRVEKKIYSKLPNWARVPLNLIYAGAMLGVMAVRGGDPVAYVRDYQTKRGMRFMNDVIDWMGGYPYESLSAQDTQKSVEAMGFQQVAAYNTEPPKGYGVFGSGCGEYVFRRV
ncbi:MAG: class I SAM-dependent methyltransferase [Alphaproteobacteria bacterium]|nr:class I SAM-dependent methyltransferase [Alphaproteobacteria bacterium]